MASKVLKIKIKMTPNECLTDELEYLNELLSFCVKIKYQVMINHIQKRIETVDKKIKLLQPETETIY